MARLQHLPIWQMLSAFCWIEVPARLCCSTRRNPQSKAGYCLAQAGVNANVIQRASLHFESRLHTAAAAYVQGLHSLSMTSNLGQGSLQAFQIETYSDSESYSAHGESDQGIQWTICAAPAI